MKYSFLLLSLAYGLSLTAQAQSRNATYSRPAAIDPAANAAFISWIIEQKIPEHYEPIFDTVGIEGESRQQLMQLLVTSHLQIQRVRLQRQWAAAQKQSLEDLPSLQALIAEQQVALSEALGNSLHHAFLQAQDDHALQTAARQASSGTINPPKVSEPQAQAVYQLLKKHLLGPDGLILEDQTQALEAMLAEAKTTLDADTLKYFQLSWNDRHRRKVYAYVPLSVVPGNLSARRR